MTARLFLRLLRRPSSPAVPVTTSELQDWHRRRAEAEADRRKPEVLCDRELYAKTRRVRNAVMAACTALMLMGVLAFCELTGAL